MQKGLRVIRAGVSGTNWTGKSATIDQFAERHPELKVARVSLAEIGRLCPYPMVEEQTVDASRWMVEQVCLVLNAPPPADIQLFDRTPLDIVAFTLLALERAGSDCDDTIVRGVLDLIPRFDYTFFVPVTDEWPARDAVAPPLNRGFALLMDRYLRQALRTYKLSAIMLPWDLGERQKVLDDHLCP